MTERERVKKAVGHQETDIIPYTVDIYADVREKLKLYYNDPEFEQKLGNHIVFMRASGFPLEGWAEPDVWRDRFGVKWDRSFDKGVGVVRELIVSEETFADYVFPDPEVDKLYDAMAESIKYNPDKFLIASVGESYFERAWSLHGMENVLTDMVVNEKFLFRLLEGILEYNMKLIDRYLAFDIDCVHINDDYGQQTGLIMGAAMWRKFFKPGLKKMAGRIKSRGKFVYLHSCGDVSEIMPDLVEIGIDILNPLQPEVMDVFRLKKEFGAHMTFHGGVSEQRTLNFGTPGDVEREMREKMGKLGKDGGYILAPSQGMTGKVPVENAAKFIEVATTQIARA